MGLAVSLGIVESHNGSLTVDCPPEGGAVFQVLLLVQVADDEQPSREPVAHPDELRSSRADRAC